MACITEQQYSLSCAGGEPQTLSCEGDNLIHIRDVIIGFRTHRTCQAGAFSTEDCVRHYDALDTWGHQTVVAQCNNTKRCQLQATEVTRAQCNGHNYNGSDYTMVTFECRTGEIIWGPGWGLTGYRIEGHICY